MNLPNKLTMIRIILVPLFVLFMALPKTLVWNLWVALGIFIVAALTDFIDGKQWISDVTFQKIRMLILSNDAINFINGTFRLDIIVFF